MEAKDFEPRCIETIQYPEGKVYAVKCWPSFRRLFFTVIVCFIFTVIGLYLVYKGLGPFMLPGNITPEKLSHSFTLLIFAIYLLAANVFFLFILADSIIRKESWCAGGFLHLRRSLFGIVWKRAIPINKIRNFEIAPAGNIRKKDYWAVNVNHYAVGRKIMMKRGGYWRLNLATALDSREAAEYFAELMRQKTGLTDVPLEAPTEIKEIADSNLRFREKLWQISYIFFGLWGLAGFFVCIALQYIFLKGTEQFFFGTPMFLLVLIPFGITSARLSDIGLNTGRDSSKEVKLKVRKRAYEVLWYFPFSAAIFILILLVDFIYATLNVYKNGDMFLLFISMVFYSFIAFINLRLFLSGRGLIEKWRREDEGQA